MCFQDNNRVGVLRSTPGVPNTKNKKNHENRAKSRIWMDFGGFEGNFMDLHRFSSFFEGFERFVVLCRIKVVRKHVLEVFGMWGDLGSAERARKARFRAFFGRNPQTAELWTGGAPIKGGYYCNLYSGCIGVREIYIASATFDDLQFERM